MDVDLDEIERPVLLDRVVSDELMSCLQGPVGDSLRARRAAAPRLLDVQLRRDKGGRSWATLYMGLTKLIDIFEKKGEFWLDAHPTWKAIRQWDESWKQQRRSPTDLATLWPAVERYLDAAQLAVTPRFVEKEGKVHAALSSGASDAFRIINREASPSFASQPVKDALRAQLWAPIDEALAAADNAEAWWPKKVRVGDSLDLLSVDIGGRLALIEAKHHSATGMIAKVAAQVGMYARLYSYMLQVDEEQVLNRFDAMLRQRVELRLSHPGILYLTKPIRIVPVVAIGPEPPSPAARERLWHVARALDGLVPPRRRGTTELPTIDPIEVWYVDADGRISVVERAGDVRPAPPQPRSDTTSG